MSAPTSSSERVKRSDRQTLINLLLALAACVAGVVLFMMITPQPNKAVSHDVNVPTVMAEAQQATEMHLVNPLQSGWSANDAEWTPAGSNTIPSWYVSMITSNNKYMGMIQTNKANPTWLATQLNKQAATSAITLNGTKVTVYDHRDDSDSKTKRYALTWQQDGVTFILYGSESPETFRTVATDIMSTQKAS